MNLKNQKFYLNNSAHQHTLVSKTQTIRRLKNYVFLPNAFVYTKYVNQVSKRYFTTVKLVVISRSINLILLVMPLYKVSSIFLKKTKALKKSKFKYTRYINLC